MDKKQQKTTTSLTNKEAKKEQPIRSENTIKGSESAVSEREASIKPDKPLVQDNNNNFVLPPSPLTNSVTIAPPREEEATQAEKVGIKSSNNIEFNPPTSAENFLTVHETSDAGRTNGSRERTEKEHVEPQYISQQEKLDE